MSSRHTKLAAGRKDMYYYMAKETGYRSRAAFKLVQLDSKYNFLNSAKCLIDLCAAPGGWSQVAVKNMPIGSVVIAVDLDPIKSIPGLQSFQSDITTQECRNELKRLINKTPVDVVVNDGAPNVSGDYDLDSFNQNVLVLYALKLASEFLKQGGTFITKIFRSGELLQLQYVLKQLFESVDLTKPKSSRDTSAEIFAVCRGFRGQFSEIDQKLFDPEVVLGHKNVGVSQNTNMQQLKFQIDHKQRHRSGYEDSLNRRFVDLVSFVISSNPVSLIAKNSAIIIPDDLANDFRFKNVFDTIRDIGLQFNGQIISSLDDYMIVQNMCVHFLSDEVKETMSDLKELSNNALKTLLLWRQKMLLNLRKDYKHNISEIQANLDIEENVQVTQEELVQQQEMQIAKEKQSQLRKTSRQEQKKQSQRARAISNFDGELLYDRQQDDGYLQIFNDKTKNLI